MIEKNKEGATEAGFFAKIGGVLDRYGPLVANIVGTVILAFSTNLVSNWTEFLDLSRHQTLIELTGIILFVVGTYFLAHNGLRVSKLESENQLLIRMVKSQGDDIQDKWRQVLLQISDAANLGNSCRISIYRCEESFFIMLGRFSLDPQKQKTGRGFYPINEGCIGEAYRNGVSFVADLPDATNNDYFLKTQSDWAIDPQVASNFKMKARSIAAFALADPKILKRSLILVFESTDSKAFKKKDLQAACEIYNDMLCGLEKTLEPLLPSLHYAKQKGF